MIFKTVQQAVVHARAEIPRFQERIDQLKRTLKTDSAVNLGISVKRFCCLWKKQNSSRSETRHKKEAMTSGQILIVSDDANLFGPYRHVGERRRNSPSITVLFHER